MIYNLKKILKIKFDFSQDWLAAQPTIIIISKTPHSFLERAAYTADHNDDIAKSFE